MSAPSAAAAPASGNPDIPTYQGLAADPEIAALLEFEPVARKVKRPDGWTAELQRELIARIAATGTLQSAVWQMGKHATGAEALYKVPGADSFRAAWDAALALGRRRNGLDVRPPWLGDVPGITRRKIKERPASPDREGQRLNEFGEWEDEESMRARAEDARDSITMKLLNARRLYLAEISNSPGKRAAFEILTELPIDWELASQLKPQPNEPWHRVNMRKPDMLLTAENGWLNDCARGIGPDKMAELRAAVDRHRAEQGLEPVDWNDDPPRNGQGDHP
jgi:hypothetical protein